MLSPSCQKLIEFMEYIRIKEQFSYEFNGGYYKAQSDRHSSVRQCWISQFESFEVVT